MRRHRLAISAVAILGALVLIWATLPLRQPCGNKVLVEAPSSDGARKALLFQRSCGASSDIYTHVSIVAPDDKKVAVGGNVFVAQGHPDRTATNIRWDGPRTLVVETGGRDAATRMEVWMKGVLVKYEDR